MSTGQPTSNKATFSRIHEAVNSGDAEVISKTIDEVVEPNVLFHTPAPIDARGAQALKQVWTVLLRAARLSAARRRAAIRSRGAVCCAVT